MNGFPHLGVQSNLVQTNKSFGRQASVNWAAQSKPLIPSGRPSNRPLFSLGAIGGFGAALLARRLLAEFPDKPSWSVYLNGFPST